MPGETETIKQRLDIIELIGSYVTLNKAGTANFRARCPFHQEKTPSFYVSKERQMWHCFGCGEGGDHFTFVQKIEGMDFPEALRLLAEKAGVQLSTYHPEFENAKQRLLGCLDAVVKFWSGVLWDEPHGALAREYLARRLVDEVTARAFRIGYAPDSWEATTAFLGRKGYTPEEIVQAGLALKREQGSGVYDRFRGRLMFPIANIHGHIVGCTGRILNPTSAEAKYVNTPETVLYKKGAVLYGLDRARPAIKTTGFALLVEGNMDVVACHRIGMENTVAVSGTALTEMQLDLLKRFTETLVVAFDADTAGESATLKGIDLALGRGFVVKVVRVPPEGGKDADECIARSPDLWRAAVAGAKPFMDDAFEQAQKKFDIKTATGKSAAGKFLIAQISKLADQIEKTHWLQQVASLLSVPEQILHDKLSRQATTASSSFERRLTTATPAANLQPLTDRWHLLAEELLAALLADPADMRVIVAGLNPEMLPSGPLRELYTRMVLWYTEGRVSGDTTVDDPLERRLALLGEQEFGEKPPADRRADVARYLQLIRYEYLTRERKAIEAMLSEADRRGDEAEKLALTKRYQELTSQQSEIAGT